METILYSAEINEWTQNYVVTKQANADVMLLK
jgi:hypothetical protein